MDMIALKIVLAVCSLFILIVTPTIIYLGFNKPLEYAALSHLKGKTARAKIWCGALFVATFLGIGICIYQGTETLLWWIPRSWGGNDEDGHWTWLGDTIAGLMAFAGAIGCMSVLDKLARNALDERNREILEEYKRKHTNERS